MESRQFAAEMLLVAQHISSDQNALDLSAELAEKFDNKKLFASNTIACMVVKNQNIAPPYISSNFAMVREVGLLIIIPSFLESSSEVVTAGNRGS